MFSVPFQRQSESEPPARASSQAQRGPTRADQVTAFHSFIQLHNNLTAAQPASQHHLPPSLPTPCSCTPPPCLPHLPVSPSSSFAHPPSPKCAQVAFSEEQNKLRMLQNHEPVLVVVTKPVYIYTQVELTYLSIAYRYIYFLSHVWLWRRLKNDPNDVIKVKSFIPRKHHYKLQV